MDVTAFVSSPDGRHATFTPPQPLGSGQHQLRLLEYTAQGSIAQRGQWVVDIRQSAGYREAGIKTNWTLVLTHRLDEHNLTPPVPGRNVATGMAHVQGSVADDDWRLSGDIDVIGASRKPLMPRQRGAIDIGNYLFSAQKGPVVAQAGHHAAGPDSLVMQGFNRRGLSLGWKAPGDATTVTAFGMQTQNVVGTHQGYGMGDQHERTSGVVFAARPLADPGALRVWGAYLTGEGASQTGAAGAGVAGSGSASSGRAASLAAAAALLDQRLNLMGEVAYTRYDADGAGKDTDLNGVIDQNDPAQSGQGHQASIDYLPQSGLTWLGEPVALRFGVQEKRLSTYFRSLANPAAGADQSVWSGYAAGDWAGLHLEGRLTRLTDNVDNNTLLPRNRVLNQTLNLSYQPRSPVAPGQEVKLPWYGQPMYYATYANTETDVIRAGSSITAGALKQSYATTLGAAFSYPSWTWGVSHNFGEDEDRRQLTWDVRHRSTHLNANFLLGALTLTPSLGYHDEKRSDPPAGLAIQDRDTLSGGLGLSYAFSDAVSSSLNYILNREKTSDRATNRKTYDVSGSVSWIAIAAKPSRPGLSFAVEGAYHDERDRGTAATTIAAESYQIFLKATLSLP